MIVNFEEFKIFYDEDNLCFFFISDVYFEDVGRYIVVVKNELGIFEIIVEFFVVGENWNVLFVFYEVFKIILVYIFGRRVL